MFNFKVKEVGKGTVSELKNDNGVTYRIRFITGVGYSSSVNVFPTIHNGVGQVTQQYTSIVCPGNTNVYLELRTSLNR